VRRLLNPATNSAGLTLIAAVAYLVTQLAGGHADLTQPRLYLPVLVAAIAWYTRSKVTPLADPRDGNGEPLLTAGQHLRAQRAQALAGERGRVGPRVPAEPGNVSVVTPSATGTGPAAGGMS